MVLEDNTGMADFHTSLLDAVNVRITTRMYEDEKIDSDLSRQLRQNIDAVNLISGLHMQLIENCPQIFARANAEGHFRNAQNFIALIGSAGSDEAREAAGYYGERVVLSAVLMGLQTGWVAGSWDKAEAERCCDISDNEELYLGIVIGYQEEYSALMEESYEQRCETQRTHRPSKSADELFTVKAAAGTASAGTAAVPPQWFMDGVAAAAKAPSAMNRQPAMFSYNPGSGSVEAYISGRDSTMFAYTDLGIAKLHFQIGAGGGSWEWGDRGTFSQR